MLEIVILLILGLWLYLAIRKLRRDKKNGTCTGCSSCGREGCVRKEKGIDGECEDYKRHD